MNRLNPNPQAGMIYCSNLCTEIAQNMRGVDFVSREVREENGETVVVTTTKPGDFVVCNLASLSLGTLPVRDDEAMGAVVRAAMRALDNVIDLNFYPVTYAGLTNRRYRAVGLRVHGYHHMLAKHGVLGERQAPGLCGPVFELILNHSASADIPGGKGRLSLFETAIGKAGPILRSGADGPKWRALAEKVWTTCGTPTCWPSPPQLHQHLAGTT